MRSFRRVVHTFVAVWVAAFWIKVLGWIVPMSDRLQGALALAAMVIAGVAGWSASRRLAPWTPKDLRDGAIGYGIVLLILPLAGAVAAALVGQVWIAVAATAVAVLVVAGAAFVHRHAEALGVAEPDDRIAPPDGPGVPA